MIEEHTFVDAYFTNNDRSVLESLWLDPTGKITRPFYIEVNKDPDIYKEFLKTKRNDNGVLTQVTEDWIHERTYKRIREQRTAYEAEIVRIAKENNEYLDVITENGVNHDLLLKYLDDTTKTVDKEIFALKLRMFEREHVNYSEDRELKAKLRKAQSIKEVVKLYLEF
tara:strand:+ start:109 stop:612 length:504 start_codon:yes stop_codon:yes gene_type:complete